jgi:hypothetical protein
MARGKTFRFNPEAFLEHVEPMGYEDRGKYITLLCFMHRRGKMCEAEMIAIVGDLPDEIGNKFKVDENGYWRNRKLKDGNMSDVNTVVVRQNELFDAIPEKPLREKFVPPQPEEVEICFMKRGLSKREAEYETEKFISHYTKTNWRTTHGAKIIDWNAAITTWMIKKKEFSEYKPHKTLTEQWLE